MWQRRTVDEEGQRRRPPRPDRHLPGLRKRGPLHREEQRRRSAASANGGIAGGRAGAPAGPGAAGRSAATSGRARRRPVAPGRGVPSGRPTQTPTTCRAFQPEGPGIAPTRTCRLPGHAGGRHPGRAAPAAPPPASRHGCDHRHALRHACGRAVSARHAGIPKQRIEAHHLTQGRPGTTQRERQGGFGSRRQSGGAPLPSGRRRSGSARPSSSATAGRLSDCRSASAAV
jgi:hypothetical protein